jgi:hypothetical protein
MKTQAETKWTIDGIKAANERAGNFFFSPDTMRYFRSRVLPTVTQGPGGVYFVTSEGISNFGGRGWTRARRFTVRVFNPKTADVNTVGALPDCEFQKFPTAREARSAARRLASGEL